eukprot:5985180-Pyramimonas_sp.AAC.1
MTNGRRCPAAAAASAASSAASTSAVHRCSARDASSATAGVQPSYRASGVRHQATGVSSATS